MNKESLIELIELGYSQRDLAKSFNMSQSNIKYWLKKLNISTKYKEHNIDKYLIDGGKVCSKCKELKDLSYFHKRCNLNRDGYNGYCKECNSVYQVNRIKETKIKMIVYKGGECLDCKLNYINTHYCVFDFHHIDPQTKDPNFDRIRYQKWDKIKEEIDKCILLCSNCHRLRHAIIGNW